jgi:Flp pilus assembly protein TadG
MFNRISHAPPTRVGRRDGTPSSPQTAAPAPAATQGARRRTRLGSERGQAAVELALCVPVLCLIVLALIDFGKAMNYWLDANHLANEGARLAAVVGTDPSRQPSPSLTKWIQQLAGSTELLNGTGSVTSPAKVCITFLTGSTGTTGQIGDPVKVTVTAPYKWIPFVGGGTFPIKADATMRLEQRADPALNGQCSS